MKYIPRNQRVQSLTCARCWIWSMVPVCASSTMSIRIWAVNRTWTRIVPLPLPFFLLFPSHINVGIRWPWSNPKMSLGTTTSWWPYLVLAFPFPFPIKVGVGRWQWPNPMTNLAITTNCRWLILVFAFLFGRLLIFVCRWEVGQEIRDAASSQESYAQKKSVTLSQEIKHVLVEFSQESLPPYSSNISSSATICWLGSSGLNPPRGGLIPGFCFSSHFKGWKRTHQSKWSYPLVARFSKKEIDLYLILQCQSSTRHNAASGYDGLTFLLKRKTWQVAMLSQGMHKQTKVYSPKWLQFSQIIPTQKDLQNTNKRAKKGNLSYEIEF